MLPIPEGLRTSDPHDLSYMVEVLDIGNGETEDQMDARLKYEANQLGVDLQSHPAIPPGRGYSSDLSSRSMSSRSMSIDSQATSNNPSASRDLRISHRQSRTSFSFQEYDAFLARGRPVGRHSMAFSSSTTSPDSTFSLPLSGPTTQDPLPKKNFRLSRGLSILKLNRSNSITPSSGMCPHCPPGPPRIIHRLHCGHRLCSQALRETINHAMAREMGAVPSCCGVPIPGKFVELVLSPEELNALLEKLDRWDEALSGEPITLPPQPRRNSMRVFDRSDFQDIQRQQEEQRDRFLAWFEHRRADLNERHDWARQDTKTRHEGALEDLAEHHASAMAEAEDKQITAEAEMHEEHIKETRDTDIALRHMEAYCKGVYLSSGDPHYREITEKDLAELSKARHAHNAMANKHEAAINVLRGEQARRLRLRATRQEKGIQELQRQQRREELELERMCTGEMHRLESSAADKLNRIRWRWELQNATTAAKLYKNTGHNVDPRDLTIDWPQLQTVGKGDHKTDAFKSISMVLKSPRRFDDSEWI